MFAVESALNSDKGRLKIDELDSWGAGRGQYFLKKEKTKGVHLKRKLHVGDTQEYLKDQQECIDRMEGESVLRVARGYDPFTGDQKFQSSYINDSRVPGAGKQSVSGIPVNKDGAFRFPIFRQEDLIDLNKIPIHNVHASTNAFSQSGFDLNDQIAGWVDEEHTTKFMKPDNFATNPSSRKPQNAVFTPRLKNCFTTHNLKHENEVPSSGLLPDQKTRDSVEYYTALKKPSLPMPGFFPETDRDAFPGRFKRNQLNVTGRTTLSRHGFVDDLFEFSRNPSKNSRKTIIIHRKNEKNQYPKRIEENPKRLAQKENGVDSPEFDFPDEADRPPDNPVENHDSSFHTLTDSPDASNDAFQSNDPCSSSHSSHVMTGLDSRLVDKKTSILGEFSVSAIDHRQNKNVAPMMAMAGNVSKVVKTKHQNASFGDENNEGLSSRPTTNNIFDSRKITTIVAPEYITNMTGNQLTKKAKSALSRTFRVEDASGDDGSSLFEISASENELAMEKGATTGIKNDVVSKLKARHIETNPTRSRSTANEDRTIPKLSRSQIMISGMEPIFKAEETNNKWRKFIGKEKSHLDTQCLPSSGLSNKQKLQVSSFQSENQEKSKSSNVANETKSTDVMEQSSDNNQLLLQRRLNLMESQKNRNHDRKNAVENIQRKKKTAKGEIGLHHQQNLRIAQESQKFADESLSAADGVMRRHGEHSTKAIKANFFEKQKNFVLQPNRNLANFDQNNKHRAGGVFNSATITENPSVRKKLNVEHGMRKGLDGQQFISRPKDEQFETRNMELIRHSVADSSKTFTNPKMSMKDHISNRMRESSDNHNNLFKTKKKVSFDDATDIVRNADVGKHLTEGPSVARNASFQTSEKRFRTNLDALRTFVSLDLSSDFNAENLPVESVKMKRKHETGNKAIKNQSFKSCFKTGTVSKDKSSHFQASLNSAAELKNKTSAAAQISGDAFQHSTNAHASSAVRSDSGQNIDTTNAQIVQRFSTRTQQSTLENHKQHNYPIKNDSSVHEKSLQLQNEAVENMIIAEQDKIKHSQTNQMEAAMNSVAAKIEVISSSRKIPSQQWDQIPGGRRSDLSVSQNVDHSGNEKAIKKGKAFNVLNSAIHTDEPSV
jgi:hypothetical protein